MMDIDEATLRAEAEVLGRFVLHRVVDDEFTARYVEAHTYLFTEPAPACERALLDLSIRHPRLLPYMDAAAALIRPRTLLHSKGLLMAAILEASPRHAEEFLPRDVGALALAWRFLSLGVVTALHTAVGIPLLLIIESREKRR